MSGILPRLCSLLLLLFLLTVSAQVQDDRHVLQTPFGSIRGAREPLSATSGSYYYAFKGIPYATAGRWEEPQLKELNGHLIATQPGSWCPQWSLSGQRPVGLEDCLFLNVYTPTVPQSYGGRPGLSSPQLPIMVFFHPGGYVVGSGDQAGPRKLMRHRNVILVTVNYRLGVLGYLSTADSEIPGNFGLLDQITALKWVQKNIQHFGGNPHRVTIFGNSAGAASTHLLMLCPRAMGLFHGAILQSGNALCPWAVEENPKEYAVAVAEKLECPEVSDSKEILQCLKGKSMEDLVNAQQGLLDLWVLPIHAAPVVDSEWRGDDALLARMPAELMDAGAFVQVPVMTGVVKDEGLMPYTMIHLQVGDDKFKDPEYFENELLPKVVKAVLETNEEEEEQLEPVLEAIKKQYFEGLTAEDEDEDESIEIESDDTINSNVAISGLSEVFGDGLFYGCHRDFLEKLVASNTTTYSYVFTYKTPQSPSVMANYIRSLKQLDNKSNHPLLDEGVAHCDELQYLFEPYNFLPGNLNQRMDQESERLSIPVSRAWAAFATHGNPNSGLNPGSSRWRPIKDGQIDFYDIAGNRTMEFREGESIFWLRTIPYLQELGSTISDLESYNTLFWIFLGLFILFLIISIILAYTLWKKRSAKTVNL